MNSPAAGSPNKAAFDAGFLSFFGFTKNDPAAANITAAQMDNFMTTVVEPQFLGAGWQGTWSNATDEGITSRIALNETVQTSVSANEDGMRKLAMAAATVTDMFDSNVSDYRPQGGADPRREPGWRSDERPRQSEPPAPASSRTASRTPATASTCRSTCSNATSSNWKASILMKLRRA